MAQAKQGRPKKEQTKPLIFERIRSKVSRALSMSAKTSEDLDRYVTWAAAEVGAEEDEALTLTIDQAIAQFLQRDKLFQESQDDRTESGSSKEGKPPASSPALPAPRGSASVPAIPPLPRPGVAQ